MIEAKEVKSQVTYKVTEVRGRHADYNCTFDSALSASSYADFLERKFKGTIWCVKPSTN